MTRYQYRERISFQRRTARTDSLAPCHFSRLHICYTLTVWYLLHGGEYAPEKRRADAAYVIRQGEFLQPSVKIRKELFLSLFSYRVGAVGYIHIENDIRYIPAVRYHRYSAVYRHIKGYVAHLPLFAFPLTSFASRRYTLVLDAHELSGL